MQKHKRNPEVHKNNVDRSKSLMARVSLGHGGHSGTAAAHAPIQAQ